MYSYEYSHFKVTFWRQSATSVDAQCRYSMHRAVIQEIGGDTIMEPAQEREDSSLFGVAVAQWLFWISKRHPSIDKRVATALLFSILLLPLVIPIVCFLLGQTMIGGILIVFYSIAVSVVLFKASTHSRYAPRTEKDARASLSTLQFRFGQVRAKRTNDYDLYLPPGQKDTIQCACLLIPNEQVDRLAYSCIASKISDEGILVVVQNTEPHCLPCTLVGSGFEEISDIQRKVEQDYKIKEWAIGGHGVGSIPASLLAERLGIQKLVIWGACPFWNIDLSASKLAVLVVIGSNDGYWTNMSDEVRKKFKSMLPPRNEKSVFIEMIQGGNHAGFAHYGPIPGDGELSIRLEEQQKKASHLTALFLKNAQSGAYVPPSSASV